MDLPEAGFCPPENMQRHNEWQPPFGPAFISGTLRKKMGLTVESTKGEGGQRTYSLKP